LKEALLKSVVIAKDQSAGRIGEGLDGLGVHDVNCGGIKRGGAWGGGGVSGGSWTI
jgi:hypothetical protein